MLDLKLQPADCANSRSGCDWSKLGVGAVNEIGTRWCCSQDAIDGNFCEGGEGQFGRLIVNASAFDGQHRFIKVPPSGDLETTVKYPKLEEKDESGTYILIVANCNDEGRNVMVDGQYTWKSVHGYLPGDRFQEMHYFITLAFVYFILFCWYGISMKIHDESTIPIQKWVLTTIGMGFLESFFKTGDLFVWNEDGTRFWFAMYTGECHEGYQRPPCARLSTSITYCTLFVPHLCRISLAFSLCNRSHCWSNEDRNFSMSHPDGQSWMGCCP